MERYTTASEPARGRGWSFFLEPVWYGKRKADAMAELEWLAADHELNGLRVEWRTCATLGDTFTTYGYLEALAAA